MTRPVKPKPKNNLGGPSGDPGPRTLKIVFGFWLDRPDHQDGALGHHAGVLHDSLGYLFEIMQDIPQFVLWGSFCLYRTPFPEDPICESLTCLFVRFVHSFV